MRKKSNVKNERYQIIIPTQLKNELAVKAEKYNVDMSVLVRFFLEKGLPQI